MFLINIYRISNNNVSVINSINKLSDKREFLNSKFLELINQGYTLEPLKDFIIEDSNKEDDTYIDLLKHLFISEGIENRILDINKAKDKIDSLLVYANENYSKKIFDFIEELTREVDYKKALIDNVVVKSTEFIQKLPDSIQKLAVASFKEDNSLDFKENYPFLEAVAGNGTQTQIHYLVTILNQKIDSNENLTEIISVATKIKNIKVSDKNLLRTHFESLLENHESTIEYSNKERISELVKQFK